MVQNLSQVDGNDFGQQTYKSKCFLWHPHATFANHIARLSGSSRGLICYTALIYSFRPSASNHGFFKPSYVAHACPVSTRHRRRRHRRFECIYPGYPSIAAIRFCQSSYISCTNPYSKNTYTLVYSIPDLVGHRVISSTKYLSVGRPTIKVFVGAHISNPNAEANTTPRKT